MIEWIKNIDLIKSWQWDGWHIGCLLFVILIAGAVRLAWIDSFGKNKKTKVNGKK